MKRYKPKPHIADSFFLISGALVSGFALRSFLAPSGFLEGGITGISLLLHGIFQWNIALLITITNLPFVILGAYQMSRAFAIRTLLGIIAVSLCTHFIPYPEFHYDKLLVSTFGGLFLGLGIGLGMRGGCAFDGLEVVAAYTLKRTSFTMSEIILGFNIVIFLVAALRLGFETSLYAILTYYIVTKTVDYVVEGLEEYTGVTIISGHSQEIKEVLVKELGRGITVYKGERGFMKDSFDVSQPVDIVFTVITRLEVRRLKNVVESIDPNAFVFINTIKETAGGVIKRHVKHH